MVHNPPVHGAFSDCLSVLRSCAVQVLYGHKFIMVLMATWTLALWWITTVVANDHTSEIGGGFFAVTSLLFVVACSANSAKIPHGKIAWAEKLLCQWLRFTAFVAFSFRRHRTIIAKQRQATTTKGVTGGESFCKRGYELTALAFAKPHGFGIVFGAKSRGKRNDGQSSKSLPNQIVDVTADVWLRLVSAAITACVRTAKSEGAARCRSFVAAFASAVPKAFRFGLTRSATSKEQHGQFAEHAAIEVLEQVVGGNRMRLSHCVLQFRTLWSELRGCYKHSRGSPYYMGAC